MAAEKKRLKQRFIDIVYVIAYYYMDGVFYLSKAPVLGGFFEYMATRKRLTVVTVPINAKLQDKSAILPFDTVKGLVDNASYVAARDTCLCRSSHDCGGYPKELGCIYLGEGARTIKYNTKEISKGEALERLERSRSLGLVINLVWSTDEFKLLGADAEKTLEVCSCCPCCCLMFKTRNASKAYTDSILGFGIGKVMNAEKCVRCRGCERACPFKAITMEMERGPIIDAGRCKGCGRCETACKMGLLKVFPLEENGLNLSGERTPSAGDQVDKFMSMVK